METNDILRPQQPKNWLVESILVTLFCCLPFGIAGIVYATQVTSKYANVDYEGALLASQEAGKWTKIGFWSSIILAVLSFILVVVLGVGGFMAASNFK